jgi:hypothetical protein
LTLAAILLLGGCDEEEKNPEVEVHVPEGVDVKVKHIKPDDDMIIAGELALFSLAVIWALFGPGCRRQLKTVISEDR